MSALSIPAFEHKSSPQPHKGYLAEGVAAHARTEEDIAVRQLDNSAQCADAGANLEK